MTMLTSIKAWYSRHETQGLAKLAPEERADVLAFDASLKKQPLRYATIAIGLWLAMAILGKALLSTIGWFGAFVLSAIMLMSVVVAFTKIGRASCRERV